MIFEELYSFVSRCVFVLISSVWIKLLLSATSLCDSTRNEFVDSDECSSWFTASSRVVVDEECPLCTEYDGHRVRVGVLEPNEIGGSFTSSRLRSINRAVDVVSENPFSVFNSAKERCSGGSSFSFLICIAKWLSWLLISNVGWSWENWVPPNGADAIGTVDVSPVDGWLAVSCFCCCRSLARRLENERWASQRSSSVALPHISLANQSP